MDIAREFPNAGAVAVDLVPMQSTYVLLLTPVHLTFPERTTPWQIHATKLQVRKIAAIIRRYLS